MCEEPQLSAAYRFARVSANGVQWRLKRNCSVSPWQLCATFGVLCVVSLFIAGYFWFMGATLVMPFAVFEVVALGLAFVVYARHAADAECISLDNGRLVIEVEKGGRKECAEFLADWVRVEFRPDSGALIEITGQGRRVVVGHHVQAGLRPALAAEIRQVLRSGLPMGV